MTAERWTRWRGIPVLPGAHPVWGHSRAMLHDRLALLERLAAAGEELVAVDMLFKRLVFATGADAAYDVLVRQARSFQKSPVFRSALYPLAGDGLFTSEDPVWRRQRQLMAPIFRRRDLHAFADSMAACTERAAATWEDGAQLDVARETTRIAMGIAGKTLFDVDTFQEAEELGRALSTALDWVNTQIGAPHLLLQVRVRTSLVRASRLLPGPLGAACGRAADDLVAPLWSPGRPEAALALLERRVEQMLEERIGGSEPGDDLMGKLVSAYRDARTEMDDRQIRDEILTLFVAGHETTASALAWTLHLLFEHPWAYEQARAEVDALPDRPVRAGDLEQLSFCRRVFQEALRLYPPLYLGGRLAMEPVEVAGRVLPTATTVMICPYILHRRDDLWPRPEQFDPDRFLPEAEARRPRSAYIPFGDGPRTCIGKHFALMEGPIVLATMLQHADFAPAGQARPVAGATLRPHGLEARIRLRRRASAPQGGDTWTTSA